MMISLFVAIITSTLWSYTLLENLDDVTGAPALPTCGAADLPHGTLSLSGRAKLETLSDSIALEAFGTELLDDGCE